jgi:hypothetical protein
LGGQEVEDTERAEEQGEALLRETLISTQMHVDVGILWAQPRRPTPT